jgi:hypothetical protein
VVVLPLVAEEITEELNVLPRELVSLGTGSDAGISGGGAVVAVSETSFEEDRRDGPSPAVVGGCLAMYFGNENGYALFCSILSQQTIISPGLTHYWRSSPSSDIHRMNSHSPGRSALLALSEPKDHGAGSFFAAFLRLVAVSPITLLFAGTASSPRKTTWRLHTGYQTFISLSTIFGGRPHAVRVERTSPSVLKSAG